MQYVPMAMTAIGGLIQAHGQMAAGSKSRNAAYGAALDTEATGAAQELQLREAALKKIGEQRAAQAGNGFLGGTGSALDALHESYVNMAMDVLQLRREAAGKARALRAEGDQAYAEGRAGAVATMLGSAAKVWGMAQDWAASKAYYGAGAVPSSASSGLDSIGSAAGSYAARPNITQLPQSARPGI